jgi:hypothetical protein
MVVHETSIPRTRELGKTGGVEGKPVFGDTTSRRPVGLSSASGSPVKTGFRQRVFATTARRSLQVHN